MTSTAEAMQPAQQPALEPPSQQAPVPPAAQGQPQPPPPPPQQQQPQQQPHVEQQVVAQDPPAQQPPAQQGTQRSEPQSHAELLAEELPVPQRVHRPEAQSHAQLLADENPTAQPDAASAPGQPGGPVVPQAANTPDASGTAVVDESQLLVYAAGTSTTNKWAKNGFGETCLRTGGKFTREETEAVRRAVEEYCAIRQIPTSRLCSECDHKAELKGAWMEIAKRLPHRSVQSVYRHGLRQLHPFKRGPWADDECETLLQLVQRMGKKWSAIQGKLNRSADSCRDKYREMSTDYVKGRWKENETEILKRLIRDHLRADPNADIRELGKMVEREGIVIPWSVISKRMGKRSRLSCFKKWQKMTGLYSPSELLPKPTTALSPEAQVKAEAAEAVAAVQAATAAAAAVNGIMPVAAATATAVDNPSMVKEEQTPTETPRPVLTAATAGAAAAAAAMASQSDMDFGILSELATSGATRDSDVDWNNWRIEDAHARWTAMLEEWQDETQPDDTVLGLPICEIARLLLDRKQQAKMAAETVEAVGLPTLKREV